MYKQILDKIKEYNCIAIYRHQKPDGDAMFSALALYSFIKDNFKDKKVKVGGFDIYDIESRNDAISDSFIKKSLSIIVDTSTSNRIDDDRALNADYIIRIDHHPSGDNYGNCNIEDPIKSSCAELLADIFLSDTFRSYKLSKKVCRYLYSGIVTDTINFRTTNVTADTLSTASTLIKIGELKAAEIVSNLLDKDYSTYLKVSKIRNHLKIVKQFGYIVLNQKQLDNIGLDYLQAKNNIDEIGTIKDLNVWAFVTQNPSGLYDISVRSRRNYIINDILNRYNGGGHKNAAATKNLKKAQLNSLLNELIELSTK